MEQHPVPQNVTTFQFRLIGDMTIKQFGYLAAGAIGGYIFYKLPLPFFFDWPLAVFSVVLGIGLAFVPIEERPMDVWLLSFIKSIYSPTQYIWSRQTKTQEPAAPPKTPTQPAILPAKVPSASSTAQKLEQLFRPAGKPSPNIPESRAPLPGAPATGPAVILSQQTPWDPLGFFKQLFTAKPKIAGSPMLPPHQPIPAPAIFTSTRPLPSLTGQKLDLTQLSQTTPDQVKENKEKTVKEQAATEKEKEFVAKLEKMQKELAASAGSQTANDARILELQKQLTEVLSERSKMEQELSGLRTKLHAANQAPQVLRQAGVVAEPQTAAQPTVRVITPEAAVKAGLPRLTTFPNVVTGITKDAEGNLLTGILVTVRDKDDVPVRALKTNKLGQYAASTPLPNGTYTVDIEDPRGQHFFDRVRVTLNGVVMAPVEITSKSKKEMDRSKLAAEIFGTKEI